MAYSSHIGELHELHIYSSPIQEQRNWTGRELCVRRVDYGLDARHVGARTSQRTAHSRKKCAHGTKSPASAPFSPTRRLRLHLHCGPISRACIAHSPIELGFKTPCSVSCALGYAAAQAIAPSLATEGPASPAGRGSPRSRCSASSQARQPTLDGCSLWS